MKKICFCYFAIVIVFSIVLLNSQITYAKETDVQTCLVNPDNTSCKYNYNYLGTLKNGEKLQKAYNEVVDICWDFYNSNEDSAQYKTPEYNENDEDGSGIFYYIDKPIDLSELSFEEIIYVRYAIQYDMPLFYFYSTLLDSSFFGKDDNYYYVSLTCNEFYTPKENPVYGNPESKVSNDWRLINYNNANRRKVIKTEIEELCNKVKSEIVLIDNNYEKEKRIIDIISDSMEYNYDDLVIPSVHNIVGGMEEGMTVCEGYAKTCQMLMNYCGLPTVMVCGFLGDVENINGDDVEAHAWNAIYLDNEWRECDITVYDTGSIIQAKEYLNAPHSQMKKDHMLSDCNNIR